MKVLITRQIPNAGIRLLKEHPELELDYRQGPPLSKEEMKEAIKDADAIISVIPDKIDGEVIEAAKNVIAVLIDNKEPINQVKARAAK